MNIETVPLIAIIFVFCVICQWVAWRIRIPAIIFLLLTGIIAGPVTGAIEPEELLGELLFPFVSLSVAIILFEGSLTLKIREIKGLQAVVRNMASYGMIITWVITTAATKILIGTSWEVATLFGAIMVVTGPTVVAPILRTVRPNAAVANTLKWESIVIDPIGASLAVLVFEFIVSGGGQGALGHTLITFSQLLILGTTIGAAAGYLLGLMLRYHLIPEFLHNLTSLGIVFGSFALADFFQPESGLVAVTVFGVWLANMKGVDLEHILAFKETLSILLISLLFIILASRIEFTTLKQLSWGALFLCLTVQFIARPLNVFFSTLGSKLDISDKIFLAWIAPRGIVAAAISSLFALKLTAYGYQDARLIVPLTFTVIIFTVLLQSLTAVPIAKILNISLPEPKGILIIGANKFARMIAKTLLDQDIKVIIADSSKDNIAKAKQDKIPTYFGNPISEHAANYLGLQGIGKLLALSEHESENIAATFHFRDEFGKKNIYTLLTTPRGKRAFKLRTMPQLRGKTLFGSSINYTLLRNMADQGAVIHHVQLKDKFEHIDFLENKKDKIVPLFAIDTKDQIHLYNEELPPVAEKGWNLIYFAPKKATDDCIDFQI